MESTLIDAGPIIALFDKDDKYHGAVLRFLSEYQGNLITTWPVLTEVSHMLDFNVQVQIDFLKWISRGAIRLFDLHQEHLKRIIVLSEKYADIPMDLADSTLVIASEDTGIRRIVTVDSDYYIYRTKNGLDFQNILQPHILK